MKGFVVGLGRYLIDICAWLYLLMSINDNLQAIRKKVEQDK